MISMQGARLKILWYLAKRNCGLNTFSEFKRRCFLMSETEKLRGDSFQKNLNCAVNVWVAFPSRGGLVCPTHLMELLLILWLKISLLDADDQSSPLLLKSIVRTNLARRAPMSGQQFASAGRRRRLP